jgi:hypothetical protein
MTEKHITCPICGRTSFSRDDVVHRYCGHCHRFHDEMTVEEIRRANARRARVERFLRARRERHICKGLALLLQLSFDSKPD